MSTGIDPLDILVVAPHPDDAELGAGGLMLLAVREGLRVGILDLSRGELGTKGDIETRKAEASIADKVLGLSIRRNLGLPDGGIQDTPEYRRILVDALREYRPRLILSVHPDDRHPDHSGTADLCRAAYFLCRLPKYATRFMWYCPAGLWYYFIHELKAPALVIDVTSVFDKKMEAIKAYRSQFVDVTAPDGYTPIGTGNYLESIDALGRFWGARAGMRYGEAFQPAEPLKVSSGIGSFLSSLRGFQEDKVTDE